MLVDNHLYGADEGTLTCLEYKTGKVKWRDRGPGKCSILYADGMLYCRTDGMLYCRNERGPLTLVESNPERYVERGRFDQPDRSGKDVWPHPIISGGMLYLRDQDLLLCYDVRGK